jgi:hypothetical protein
MVLSGQIRKSAPTALSLWRIRASTWEILTRVDWLNPQDRAVDHATMPGIVPAVPLRLKGSMPFVEGDVSKPFDLNVPILKLGKLITATREETEDLGGINSLLSLYIRERAYFDKPVSIAVFGPPGTGKSFAIKQIAETIDPGNKFIEIMEYNIAQFRSPEDLGNALHRVGSVNNSGRTPLVFLDEFDCPLDKEPLGWLKFFLAPMQDGSFYGAAGTINIGRAVFVFAGGIHPNFGSFDPRSNPPYLASGYPSADEYNARIRNFAAQKGPDFISRLRGHMNIRDINAEAGGLKPLMRRAIKLRGLLEMHQFTRKSSDGEERAMIDEAVVYALLTIDRYNHGVRSMEQILLMCRTIDGHIQIGSLPSRSQLSMHVNADEFYRRFHRGRARQTAVPVDIRDELSKLRKKVEELSKPKGNGSAADGSGSDLIRDIVDLERSLRSRSYAVNRERLDDLKNRFEQLQKASAAKRPGSTGGHAAEQNGAPSPAQAPAATAGV